MITIEINTFDHGMFDSIPDLKEKICMKILFHVRLQLTYQDLAMYFKNYKHQEVRDNTANTIDTLETIIQSLVAQLKTT